MGELIGADPESLDRLAANFDVTARDLGSTRKNLSGPIHSSPWNGRKADQFRQRWDNEYARNLRNATQFLNEQANELRRQAQQQRHASAASGMNAKGRGQAQWTAPPVDPLVEGYRRLAFDRAGIDESMWDPSAGVDGNRATIPAVYEYYAKLYREHPELEWAGLAAMVGPTFAAGFTDLDQFADLAELARAVMSNPALYAALPPALQDSMRALASLSADELAEEFRWYEQRFLEMQKEIYLDMATMHEAYIRDGLDGIHALAGPMELDAKTIQAWELIDAGKRTKDQSLIAEGTRLLALREQRTIIQDDYAVMYSRLTGPAITYLATMVGQPSVPGAKSFPEVFPLAIDPGGPARVPVKSPAVGPLPSFGVELPNPLHGHVEVVTPLADGNVAHFDDRWALFTKDTLPAYEDMSRDRRLEELNKPWNQRVDDYRFHNRIDDLAKQATRWDVRRKQ